MKIHEKELQLGTLFALPVTITILIWQKFILGEPLLENKIYSSLIESFRELNLTKYDDLSLLLASNTVYVGLWLIPLSVLFYAVSCFFRGLIGFSELLMLIIGSVLFLLVLTQFINFVLLWNN